MPTNSYDLIVLGDDFAGLVAATLTARRGLRVLLGITGRDVSSYQLGPYRLPTRPLVLPGYHGPAMRRVLDELHFQHPLKRKLYCDDTPFQFVGPDARITVSSDDLALGRELEREIDHAVQVLDLCTNSAEIADTLDPLFAHDITVPPVNFRDKREIGRIEPGFRTAASNWWSAAQREPATRVLAEVPAALSTRIWPDDLSAEARVRAFSAWRSGAPRLNGDMQSLREVFLDKFASHNGEVRAITVVELQATWGGITGVGLDDGEQLGAQQVVCAMPLDDFVLAAGDKPAKRLTQVANAFECPGHRYVFNLVVDEIGIPQGIGHVSFWVGDPEKPLIEENALLVHVAEPDDEAQVVVTIEANLPYRDSDLAAAQADLRVRIRETLEHFMPFLSEHVLAAHSPNESVPAEGIEGELELAEPVAMQPIWRVTGEQILGVGGAPYQPGYKNLTLASAQVLPGLGLEGEFLAGWCAARQVTGGSGKKKDYLDGQVITNTR